MDKTAGVSGEKSDVGADDIGCNGEQKSNRCESRLIDAGHDRRGGGTTHIGLAGRNQEKERQFPVIPIGS